MASADVGLTKPGLKCKIVLRLEVRNVLLSDRKMKTKRQIDRRKPIIQKLKIQLLSTFIY